MTRALALALVCLASPLRAFEHGEHADTNVPQAPLGPSPNDVHEELHGDASSWEDAEDYSGNAGKSLGHFPGDGETRAPGGSAAAGAPGAGTPAGGAPAPGAGWSPPYFPPGSGGESRAQARSALASGDFAGAKKSASKALKANPNDARALKLRAQANYALGDKQAAAADARRAANLRPDDKKAQTLAALLESKAAPKDPGLKKLSLGEPLRAAESGSPGAEAPGSRSPSGPAPAPAESLPTGEKQAPPPSTPPGELQSQELVRQGERSLSLGEPAAAASFATRALASGGESASAYYLRGRALAAQGDHRAAAKDETAALEDKSLDAALDAIMDRAMGEVAARQETQAQRDLLAGSRLNAARFDAAGYAAVARELSSGSASPSRGSGRASGAAEPGAAGAAARSSAFLPSLEIPESAPGISPQSLACSREALARLRLRDASGAARLASLAIKLDPRNYFAYIVLAGTYRLSGDYARGVEAATRALLLQPLAAAALAARAESHLKLKDWSQAEADAGAALRTGPEDARLYRVRSAAREALGDREGSLEDRRRAESLEGAPPPASRRAPRLALWAAAAAAAAGLLGLSLGRRA